jgi:hypothetical protein
MFEPNNQYWKLRAKHGRSKIFATPADLWNAACEYFEYANSKVWKRKEYIGQQGKEVTKEYITPFTKQALSLFLGVSERYFYEFKKTCNNDFLEVIFKMEDIIFLQKLEGASIGFFNGNIIARDLQLKEQIDTSVNDANNKLPPITITGMQIL